MPYEWTKSPQGETELHLWPYRSLPRRGMVWFIGITAVLTGLPLLVSIGSPVLWGLLPFLVGAVAAIYLALQRSFHDGEILEILTLTQPMLRLTRHGPRGRVQEWQANPHWVRVNLHATGGPVPQYLTLHGSGRDVELGAFLTEAERRAIEVDLRRAIAKLQ